MDKSRAEKQFELYQLITDTIPEGYSVLDVARAAEIVIADCLAQGDNVKPERLKEICTQISEEINGLAEVFISKVYKL